MLDALVDREDRHVAGAAEAPVVEHGLHVAEDRGAAVGVGHHPVDVVGSGKVEELCGDGLGAMSEEVLGLVAEDVLDRSEVG